MAATVLPLPQHHFGPMVGQYPPSYEIYSGQHQHTQGSAPFTSPASGHQISFTSPQRWAAQQAFGRRTSKSPNVRDRTPIKHSHPEMSRHRSASRSEMLYAHAEEQSRQPQQSQHDNAPAIFVPSLHSDPSHYGYQSYAYTSTSSPYMQPQQYFDTTDTNTGYGHMPTQHHARPHMDMYQSARHDAQLPQLGSSTLDPTDSLYSQSRLAQIPQMAPVPSNFPPMPQTLESTPSEADVGGNRNKPKCWEHGCNGRQFSTFSNLLRHQREKSGTATKARCPHCGTEFTRTTARNGHLYGGKCKGISDSCQEQDTFAEEEEGT